MRRSLALSSGFSLSAAVVLLWCSDSPLQAREVQIVPAWSVQVLDAAGKPVAGLAVEARWEFFGLSPSHRGSDSRLTDALGLVVFPEQSFRVTEAGYIAGRGISALNVHASFGPSCTISIAPLGYRQADADYSTDGNVYDHNGATTSKTKTGLTTVFQFKPLDVFDFLRREDWATVKRMLAADTATANARDEGGATPLIYLSRSAFSGAHAEMMALMIETGADINAQAKDGTTALHNVAKNCDIPGMELLLSKGADPRLKIHDSVYYTTNGFTPLHFLIGAYGDVMQPPPSVAQKNAGIKCLMAKGADIDAQDATGASPLHLAAVWGDPEIIAALLAAGADPLAKNHQGQSPRASIKQLTDTAPVHKVRELLADAEAKKADALHSPIP